MAYDGDTVFSPQIGFIRENTLPDEIISSASSMSIHLIANEYVPGEIEFLLKIDSCKLPIINMYSNVISQDV